MYMYMYMYVYMYICFSMQAAHKPHNSSSHAV